jgi:hypothetical protein
MSEAPDKVFANFVNQYLIVKEAKCNRHCQNAVKFVALKADQPGIVGGYVCPGNYVSRVVYFSPDPDREWFEKFLKDQVGERVRSRDIRTATRHGWELGGKAEEEIKKIPNEKITQVYWTSYPASDEEKTSGAFRCENCGRLFVKNFADENRLCADCRRL